MSGINGHLNKFSSLIKKFGFNYIPTMKDKFIFTATLSYSIIGIFTMYFLKILRRGISFPLLCLTVWKTVAWVTGVSWIVVEWRDAKNFLKLKCGYYLILRNVQ